MASRWRVVLCLASVLCVVQGFAQERKPTTVLGSVVQIYLPFEDVQLVFNESRGGMTVQLDGKTTSVEAQRMYIGDGKVAVLLEANNQGIFLQGRSTKGLKLTKGSAVQMVPGYQMAVDLKPGDVYVTLPGINFKQPPE